MRAKFIDVGGANTRYLCAGESDEKALLLIHGGGLAADTWLRNIDALGKVFSVYAPDSLGHGFTDTIDLGTDLPQPHTTAHLISFMDTIGVEKFSVCGSSYGALIAGLVYFAVPDRVEKLILTGSGSVFDSDDDYRASLRRVYENVANTIRNPTLGDCRSRMNGIVYDPASVPDELLLMQVTQYAQPEIVEFYLTGCRNRIDAKGPIGYRILDKLEEIEAPTLVVTGRQDQGVDWRNTKAEAERIANTKCVLIDRCGHLPYVEHADEFNALIADFLRS